MLVLVTLSRDGLDVTKGNECWSCSWDDFIDNKKSDKFKKVLYRNLLYLTLPNHLAPKPDPRLALYFNFPKGQLNVENAKVLADIILWRLQWNGITLN